jgi:nitrate reductase delta subunit
MNLAWKALGALLSYPTPELVAALPEIGAVLEGERGLGKSAKAALETLVAEIGAADLIDTQERYVDLFDRGRRTSLHLFEHVHGDSRDRGQAMVDLKEVYARAGFVLAGNELPDYLPAVLEFVAQLPQAEAREMLVDCAPIVRKVGEALQDRASAYAAVLAATLELVGEKGLPPPARERPTVADKPLDDEWREEQVFFGPANGQGCGAAAPAASVVRFMPPQA